MLKFRHKMIIAFVFFVLVPILILGLVSYKISATTLQQTLSNQTIQTLRAVDRNLLAAVSEVNSFSDYVISSSEIQSYLRTNNTTSIYEFYNKQQAIAGTMYGNSQIDDFILYRHDGSVTHIKNTEVPTLETLKSSLFFNQVIKQKGGPLWLTPYENQNLFLQNDEYMLTQARVVKDVNTLNDLGYLVLNIKLNLFDTIFEDVYDGPSYEMIINNKGKILYSLNRDLIGEELHFSQISEINIKETGYLIAKWKNEKSLITYMPSSFKTESNSTLILISIKPWDSIGNDIVQIRNTTLLIVAFTISIAGLFNVLYLKRISRFIHELLKSMKQVEEGRLNERMGPFKFKELRNISIGFNNMIKRIQQLLVDVEMEQERKREAQFRVLQQQINPHFLYNTLESINALASMNGQKQISRMTINLGKLLRISINGGYEVKVMDEIRHVISYLEIQKIRYDNRFSYVIEVEDALKHYSVLKLILQPLVENILNHAFSQQDHYKGLIKISGTIRNGQGELWIEDNGKGIEKNVLMELNSWKLEKNNQRPGHGIRNVDERLRLFYGEKFGLTICSRENVGTIMKIAFPVKGD